MHRKANYKLKNIQNLANRKKKDAIFKDIYVIIKVFYLVFFMFPLPKISNTQARNGAAAIMDGFVILFLSYSFCVDFYDISLIIERVPASIFISTLTADLTSIFIRLILMKKRKKIIRMLCSLLTLQDELVYKKKTYYLKYLAYLVFGSLVPAVYMTNVIGKLQIPNTRIVYQKQTFFGWYSDDFWSSSISIVTVDLLTHQQHYFVQGFCVILCCHVFKTMSNILKNFRKRLAVRRHGSLKRYLLFFGKYSYKLQACVDELEDSLSLLLTLLYGFLIWNIFLVITFLVRYRHGNIPLMPFLADLLTFSITSFSFLIISVRASSIHDSAMSLQNSVHQTVAFMASADQQEGNLLIKMATDFSSKVAVTGSKLFTLKRSIVLKIVSAGISYGLIITQLGQ